MTNTNESKNSFKRKIDVVGRISLPSDLLNQLNIPEDATLLIYLNEDLQTVTLKAFDDKCVFCNNVENNLYLDDYDLYVCSDYRKKHDLYELTERRYEKYKIRKNRRLVLPVNIRKILELSIGDYVELIPGENEFLLKKA